MAKDTHLSRRQGGSGKPLGHGDTLLAGENNQILSLERAWEKAKDNEFGHERVGTGREVLKRVPLHPTTPPSLYLSVIHSTVPLSI